MGNLIVFEGIDGSGKSTQFEMMCRRLESENRLFKRLVFPRYSEPSSTLIRMYLGGEFGDSPDSVNAYAASSFYAVDRYASFVQDWREYYENGGLILTDRYTTSNAIHQGAKLTAQKREQFFKWLYDYEFNLIGLPSPDMVMYMNIDAEFAVERLRYREAETDTNADIHESDMVYLRNCAESGKQASSLYGWHNIMCMSSDTSRNKDDIHMEIYNKLCKILM